MFSCFGWKNFTDGWNRAESIEDRIFGRTCKNEEVQELIFALSSTMEGDTTAFYLYKILKDTQVNFSTIARGIAVGDEIEYADEATLVRSIQNRIPYSDDKS